MQGNFLFLNGTILKIIAVVCPRSTDHLEGVGVFKKAEKAAAAVAVIFLWVTVLPEGSRESVVTAVSPRSWSANWPKTMVLSVWAGLVISIPSNKFALIRRALGSGSPFTPTRGSPIPAKHNVWFVYQLEGELFSMLEVIVITWTYNKILSLYVYSGAPERFIDHKQCN